ncbi:MAG: hypothetical protein EX341_17400 [Candidatus Scalindua sp. SCAELEC01]|nr:UbiA family prenyltransferase [Planctomycetota bacterium]RZV66652.1 MAG: hypothetical protein EX341_17400 [Candidatus Scalindua sp. SCAELEC01]
MLKQSISHIYPYMKGVLDLTQKKGKGVLNDNVNLLKGLNIPIILSLARLHVYMPICFFSTMVGLDIANISHSFMSLMTIGFANTFALIATFVFNDAEDAPEDMLARSQKNVIALGKVSKGTAYLIAALAGTISLSIAMSAGLVVCLIILTILVTTFLYSWRDVRLKAMPFWDVFTHVIVGGLMFLSSAWSSQRGVIWEKHLLFVCLIFSLGTVLALLSHQLYDYEDDLNAKVKTTVVVIGKKSACWFSGGIFLLFVFLIINEYRSGVFALKSIISFWVVTVGLIILSIMLDPKQAAYRAKCTVPWAVNAGALSAIITWNFT